MSRFILYPALSNLITIIQCREQEETKNVIISKRFSKRFRKYRDTFLFLKFFATTKFTQEDDRNDENGIKEYRKTSFGVVKLPSILIWAYKGIPAKLGVSFIISPVKISLHVILRSELQDCRLIFFSPVTAQGAVCRQCLFSQDLSNGTELHK